jgi:hypothetical protein
MNGSVFASTSGAVGGRQSADRTVRLVYTKYDGSLHWHLTMRLLGEDEHGVWLGTAKPTTMRKGNDPLVVLDYASLALVPRNGWWTASFNDVPASTEIYCDITSPARWTSADEVTMVDLDLDVLRTRDGAVLLVDTDEFAEHQVKYGYPADVVAEAERAANWLTEAVADGTEPFASEYRRYLAQVSASTPDQV